MVGVKGCGGGLRGWLLSNSPATNPRLPLGPRLPSVAAGVSMPSITLAISSKEVVSRENDASWSIIIIMVRPSEAFEKGERSS